MDSKSTKAQQISQIYSKNKTALVEVLNILLYIAEADGQVSEPEVKMIREIAFIFNLSCNSNEAACVYNR